MYRGAAGHAERQHTDRAYQGPAAMGRIEGMSLSTILLILAFIAFVLAAIGWSYRKTNLLAIGLALWVLSMLITQIHIG